MNRGHGASLSTPHHGRRISRAIGAAVVVVLVADIAVAVTGSSRPTHHPRASAVAIAPPADVAAAVTQPVAQPPVVARSSATRSPTAARRIGKLLAVQGAHRRAAARAAITGAVTAATAGHAVAAGAARGGLVGTSAPKQDLAQIPRVTYLATMRHGAPGFASATAKHPSMRVPRNWYGRTSVLPILSATKKRVEVRLSRRPNESTTWLRVNAINVGYSVQAILIDISQRRLYVFKLGKQKYSFPVGVGRRQTPTPTGTFFLAFHAPPNGPEYGSVMLETSAHSTAFRTFGGGNDAIIAIHGPIGSDAAIGTHGAAISNGCIRMHESQLRKAARVEDGSLIILHK